MNDTNDRATYKLAHLEKELSHISPLCFLHVFCLSALG